MASTFDPRIRELSENQISKYIVQAAVEVHRTLGGPGLLESIYERALAWELQQKGLRVRPQVAIPVRYKSITIDSNMRLDLIVNDKVIVECKSAEKYHPVFEAQALTYLRITGLKLALVINFGEVLVKDGIYRVVNGLEESE